MRAGGGRERREEGGWETALKWIAIDCAAIVWIAVDCIAIDCTVIGSIEIDWVAGEGEEGGEEVRAGEGREQREGGWKTALRWIAIDCVAIVWIAIDCIAIDWIAIVSFEINLVAGEEEEGGGRGEGTEGGGEEDCIAMDCNRLRGNRLDCNGLQSI